MCVQDCLGLSTAVFTGAYKNVQVCVKMCTGVFRDVCVQASSVLFTGLFTD